MDNLKKWAEHLIKKRPEEDFIDTVNCSLTAFLLYLCATFVFAKEYGPVSQPLYCWSQAEWNSGWMEYAHDFCFVESTYFVPLNNSIPNRGHRNNGSDQLSYYQWVPFIIVAMALVNQVPHYFWRAANMSSDLNLPAVLGQASKALFGEAENGIAAGIGRHFHVALLANTGGRDPMFKGKNILEQQKRMNYVKKIASELRQATVRNWLTILYLITKIIALIINIGQFWFISIFLGASHIPSWGIDIVDTFMVHGSAWEHNGLFPRVSLCDLKIRQPGDRFHEFTVQCVLMVNFLNEKIFTVLYYWFVFMALLSFVNLIGWAWTLILSSPDRFVCKLVELGITQLFPDPNQPLNSAGQLVREHTRVSPTTSIVSTGTIVSMSDSGMSSSNGSTTSTRLTDGTSFAPSLLTDDEKWASALEDVWEKRNNFYKEFKLKKKAFINRLGTDGILAFKMMDKNANPQMASLIMCELFKAFQQWNQKQKMIRAEEEQREKGKMREQKDSSDDMSRLGRSGDEHSV